MYTHKINSLHGVIRYVICLYMNIIIFEKMLNEQKVPVLEQQYPQVFEFLHKKIGGFFCATATQSPLLVNSNIRQPYGSSSMHKCIQAWSKGSFVV